MSSRITLTPLALFCMDTAFVAVYICTPALLERPRQDLDRLRVLQREDPVHHFHQVHLDAEPVPHVSELHADGAGARG